MRLKNFSVVIPCYNEEKNIPLLANEIRSAFANVEVAWEIIFIDDGSSDDSYAAALKECKNDERFHVIHMTTNLGKSAAYMAGFNAAKFDIVCTMDGDIQDDPSDVLNLVERVAGGADLAIGWKKTGKSDPTKWFISKLMNWLIRICTGLRLHDMNCPLRAMDSGIAKKLNLHGSLFRYIPIMVSNWTCGIVEVPVANRSRAHGTSKYSFKKYPQALADFVTVIYLTTYEIRPLHFFGLLGVIAMLIGSCITAYVVFLFLFHFARAGENVATLMLGIFFILAGVQFISTGLLGELIIHNFNRFMPLHKIHQAPYHEDHVIKPACSGTDAQG